MYRDECILQLEAFKLKFEETLNQRQIQTIAKQEEKNNEYFLTIVYFEPLITNFSSK